MEYVNEAKARYSAASTDQQRKELAQQKTGCKGSYSLRKLPLHKVHEEEKVQKRFPMSWLKDNHQKRFPPAPFALSKDDITLAS